MKNTSKTRLFFVTGSEEDNEELFETLEEAQAFLLSVIGTNKNAFIKIAMVRNYYFEKDLKRWNYKDCADTFTFVKKID